MSETAPSPQPPVAAEQPPEVRQGFVSRIRERFRNSNVAKVAAVGAIAILAFGAGKGKFDCAADVIPAAGGENDSPDIENCSDITLSNVAFENYETGQFLPPAEEEVGDADAAAEYTQSWFNEDGPLGGTVDPASEAVMFAAAGYQAKQGKSINNSETYQNIFNQSMKKLNNKETALQEAERLCGINSSVLGQTVGYDDAAIAKGEQFTTFTAVNGKNSIKGLKLDRQTANATISGTVFKLQNSEAPSGLNGFTEVVVEDDGTINVKGFLPNAGKEKNDKQKGKGGRDKNDKKHKKNGKGGGNNKQDNQNGGGGTYDESQNANGESNNPGSVPQSGGNGGYNPDTPPSIGPGGGNPKPPAPTPKPTPTPPAPTPKPPAPTPKPTPTPPAPTPTPTPPVTPPKDTPQPLPEAPGDY